VSSLRVFQPKFCTHIWSPMLYPSCLLRFDCCNNVWWKIQIMNLPFYVVFFKLSGPSVCYMPVYEIKWILKLPANRSAAQAEAFWCFYCLIGLWRYGLPAELPSMFT
jgi:hypothetical protein